MYKLKYLIVLMLSCYVQLTFAQQAKSSGIQKIHTIPFHITSYNNISIEAILNEKDTVHLMFHTAAYGVTLTEESVKRLKTIKFDSSLEGVKSWGGQDNSARLSKSNSLQIGTLKWDKLSIWENKNSGQETDGKLGIDFFKDWVLAINFDKKLITLYDQLPKEARKYEKLKLIIENDNPFIMANCIINGKILQNKFLIHSGYAGSILFDDKFTADNKLSEQLKTVSEKALKDSYGNVLKTKNAILPIFSIGKAKFEDVPVGFFEGAIGRQKMSILGGDLLKRFNIIIDNKNEFVYLKPNKLKDVEFSRI